MAGPDAATEFDHQVVSLGGEIRDRRVDRRRRRRILRLRQLGSVDPAHDEVSIARGCPSAPPTPWASVTDFPAA